MTTPARIVLVGFSGTGKTTLAQLIGSDLGWKVIDLDTKIEARAGKTIPAIFAEHGEAHFRAIERNTLTEALGQSKVVIATGGGAVVPDEVWTANLLSSPETLVIALNAPPEVILRRLQEQKAREGEAVERPMLDAADPLQRIEELLSARRPAYDRAAITLSTEDADPSELAGVIAHLVGKDSDYHVFLDAPSGNSNIVILPGSTESIASLAQSHYPNARCYWLLTDANVGAHYGDGVALPLRSAGFEVESFAVPAGEASKSVAVASEVWDWLLTNRIERSDVVIALGGGVVGDLAGFIAATTLRGIGLIQVPTSLLAMVDSSVGGKTGINHPAGKNLIGAFFQPPLVIIDPTFLKTLPPRELTSGWAEVIKHAIIQPTVPGQSRGDLQPFLERNARQLLELREPALSYLIYRNVALKAAVVEADEREAQLRAILNFGHTIGHAIEAAGYRYLHGEAIAVGIRAATRLGQALGTVEASFVARTDALLDTFGLPKQAAFDPDRVLQLISSDKKRVQGTQTWVMPQQSGGVFLQKGIDDQIVRQVLMELVAEPVAP